jgi:hypothetical protein
MNEVHKAMLISKLKVYVATAVLAVVLGAGGLAYQASGQDNAPAPQKVPPRPLSEVELLRKEMEILKLQVEVLQEKVRAQGAELRALQGRAGAPRAMGGPLAAPGSDTQDMRPLAPPAAVGAAPLVAPPVLPGPAAPGARLRELQDKGVAPLTMPPPASQPLNALPRNNADVEKEIQDAIEAFRNAPVGEAKQRAAEALEKALKKLRRKSQPASNGPATP